MRHSLRFRALLLVFLFNSIVFAALGVVLARHQAAAGVEKEEGWTENLVATIQNTIAPEGFKVAAILRWPYWRFFADAVLVDQDLRESFGGELRAGGIDLNPAGVAERGGTFERQFALRAIHAAMLSGRPLTAVGGRAVPIRVKDGIWGGLWYRPRTTQVDYVAVLRGVLPWFALSTLLLTGATYLALRRLVLDPVAQLAVGAARVRAGDFGARLAVPTRRDELADLVRSFNEMTSTVESFNQRLSEEVRIATEKARAAEAAAMRERRLAAMGELAAGIAHEINNPLGGLQNAVEDLRKPELPAARRAQYLDLLARGLGRIGETVARLRRFTPREAPLEDVDLLAVVHDALELVAHRAVRLGVELVLAGGAPPPVVAGWRNDVGQAVLNVLVNALDALEDGGTRDPRGPRIDLGLSSASDGVRLVVRDNGPGVEPAALQRVGDLFYTTKEVGRGTGLGLSLVHSAMKRHGGDLRLASERGHYFQAELHFPPAVAGRGGAGHA
ncbi:MAG: HAMP domain-containing histidine kinase [Planctomycetes bacterium]|nr:HAMP domain-containing histidine kinase [Planctomycetota bacterium]